MSDNQQNLSLFIKESRVITDCRISVFNTLLADALKSGWLQNGNMFAVGDEYAVNVIRIDQRLIDLTQQILDVGLSQLSGLA